MFKFLTNRPFWVNLLVAIGIVVLLLVLLFSSLSFLTRHNKNSKVPSVTGRNVEEAKRLLESLGFDVEVQDSIYLDNAARLSVTKQQPEADAVVKNGRTVYLTINRAVAPLVEMPDLRGFSYLSAKLYLQSLGLKMGDTSYTPDIAKNAVREQKIHGRPVAPGTKVNMGTEIDFVLGSGIGNSEMNVPDLLGMTVGQAREFLATLSVSLGAVVTEAGDAVSDTENAYITRQKPMPYEILSDGSRSSNKIRSGQLLDVYISSKPPSADSAH
ncbi:PASTA domain, binds beta-lactams [Filimonas lacunae]|uniref:PASTA domain, binds beta-lactams n=1 Tax=Filimonas lacunae TaxID=477680 RepID=A0A173MKV1_9BACT|nr:PASTA domain-containing protein [Filimonas lacunae]BAV08275.1 hypothetical protein FLA_4311 [Filimonas lacunae]SIT33221.1 PASTA domain, binds beta-lactams [Filimonas lacunae]